MSIEIMLNIKLPTNLLLIPTVALLSACGGGGDTTIDPPSLSNSERAILLNDIFLDIGDNIGAFPEDVTELADLPVEGSVQYSGAAYVAASVYRLDTRDVVRAYLGELELEAFFADDNISGVVAMFALLHGSAHGLELNGAQNNSALLGMLLATATLHGIGYLIGLQKNQMRVWLNNGLAFTMMAFGTFLLVY